MPANPNVAHAQSPVISAGKAIVFGVVGTLAATLSALLCGLVIGGGLLALCGGNLSFVQRGTASLTTIATISTPYVSVSQCPAFLKPLVPYLPTILLGLVTAIPNLLPLLCLFLAYALRARKLGVGLDGQALLSTIRTIFWGQVWGGLALDAVVVVVIGGWQLLAAAPFVEAAQCARVAAVVTTPFGILFGGMLLGARRVRLLPDGRALAGSSRLLPLE